MLFFTYSSIRLDDEGETEDRRRGWKWEEETQIVKPSIFYTRKCIQTTPHPQYSEKTINQSIDQPIYQLISGFDFNLQKEKVALAKDLKLRPRQVEVWFQNRRARKKLKKTEVDCEMLKRYCDNLSEENRRLQRELMDLKAPNHNTTTPINLPMQITTCPSCQRRINNDGDFESFHRQRISNLY